jgi:hypothetical protein
MTAITAIFKQGQSRLHVPPDWPEGCRLRVEPETTMTARPRVGFPVAREDWLAQGGFNYG